LFIFVGLLRMHQCWPLGKYGLKLILPTLRGLVSYLQSCPDWDYRRLSTEHRGFNAHIVSYGNPVSCFTCRKFQRKRIGSGLLSLCGNSGEEVILNCICGDVPSYRHEYYSSIGEEGSEVIACCGCGLSLGAIGRWYFVRSEIVKAWNNIMRMGLR